MKREQRGFPSNLSCLGYRRPLVQALEQPHALLKRIKTNMKLLESHKISETLKHLGDLKNWLFGALVNLFNNT